MSSRRTNRSRVTRRWDSEVKVSNQQRTPLSPDVGIVQVFDDEAIAGKLLILGAPGSGKTTTLVQLSQELINRAEADVAAPMPVLCNLSSWRDDGQALAVWLVDTLKMKYGVRKDHGNAWLSERLLVPLLDGLDEVAPEHQEACVRAINRFQQDYRPKHIVVCCRRAEYENYQTKLHLNGAIHLLPLADDQIHQYLMQTGSSDLWQSIRGDQGSMELARSPLLLRIITVAHEDTSAQDWQRLASASERQAYLFEVYIRRVLSDDAATQRYSKARTVHWLAWLARTMKDHGQPELLIEHPQPTWLPSVTQRLLYRFGVVVSGAVAFVLTLSLGLWLFDVIPRGALGVEASNNMKRMYGASDATWQQVNWLITTVLGLAAGVILATRGRIQPIETLVWSRARGWHGMTSGLRKMALAGLNYLTFAGLEIGLLGGAAMLRGFGAADKLSPVMTRWSVAGYIAAAVAILSLAVAVGLTARPSGWLAGGIDTRSRGGAANAVVAGLTFSLGAWPGMGLLLGASAGLSLGIIVGFSGGSNTLSAERFAKAMVIGLIGGSGIGAIAWWIAKLQSGFVDWVGIWMLGGVGVAATTALFIGLAARLKNQPIGGEVAAPGVDGRVRKWSEGLVVGGIIAAIFGLILGVVGRSGGLPTVRGMALMIARLGTGWVGALSFSLVTMAPAAVLGTTMGAFLGALFGVLKGLTGPDVERRTVPNQGIRQSAVNVGVFALAGGLIVGLPYGATNVMIAATWNRMAPGALDWANLGLGPAVMFGLLGGLVPAAACIQHFTLRFVLSYVGLALWRYARFLNYATERMLLQRVGGRYRFIHGLLREHFAAMPDVRKG